MFVIFYPKFKILENVVVDVRQIKRVKFGADIVKIVDRMVKTLLSSNIK